MLIVLNLALALFNLLPVFPLDGGRIFRALLSIKFSRLTATRIAVFTGQFFAIVLLGYVLWNWQDPQYILAIIGLFVFMTASSEYRYVKSETIMRNYQVSDLMKREF